MRRSPILIASALATLSLAAQNKIDNTGRLIIDATRESMTISRSDERLRPVTLPYDISPEQKYTVTLTVDEADFDDESLEVVARRGDMVIVRLTALQMDSLAALPSVRQLSVGNEVKALMNTARKTTFVDELQEGSDGLDGVKYTGVGVIAGLMDLGLDVNHVNFLDADGQPRTKALWSITRNGAVSSYETPQRIKNFTTDSRTDSHGTHVLGIMAGSYNGPAEYAFYNTRNTLQIKKQTGSKSAIPYYGIATDAELAVACGSFSGSNVEIGAEKVVQYAKAQGKPCVVNLSVGNNIGPHDGTDSRSRWLASLGEDAIICVAAGNEGDNPVSISKTFAGEPLRTFASSGSSGDGQIEFWGADDKIYTVKFYAYNLTTGEQVYSYTLDKNLAGKSVTIAGSYYNAPGYIHDNNFDKAFGNMSAAIITSNIDTNNNRYTVNFTLQLSGTSTNYAPAFEVTAPAGQRVDAFANGELYFRSLGVDGYTDGTPDCSINGLGCGDNVLVVGSFTNVQSWPTLAGSYHYNDMPVAGAISSFSGYGETFDGRKLPNVCAPGGSIISSYSKYYVDGGSTDSKTLTGIYTGDTRNSYWGEMQGTSMACPVVSGIVATWLQADPSLTIADVKDIIKRTAIHDSFTEIQPERWGDGKIDALAGLKDILGSAGISDVVADADDIFVTALCNNGFEVFVSGATSVGASLYNLSGTRVAMASADGDTVTLAADGAAPGVYVLKIEGARTPVSRKVILK